MRLQKVGVHTSPGITTPTTQEPNKQLDTLREAVETEVQGHIDALVQQCEEKYTCNSQIRYTKANPTGLETPGTKTASDTETRETTIASAKETMERLEANARAFDELYQAYSPGTVSPEGKIIRESIKSLERLVNVLESPKP